MDVTWDDLLIDLAGIDAESLLEDWQWLIKEPMRLVALTTFGDAFLCNIAGQVFWLDTTDAKLTHIANDIHDFRELSNIEPNKTNWFLPYLVADVKAKGTKLEQMQCYSFVHPPILGGTFDASNVEVSDVYVHLSLLGQIQEQVKDLPEGTTITQIKIEK
jgi:hypothetical protein